MREPVVVSKAKPAARSQQYAELVAEGMGYIQKWTSETWNDHNVHDPGITLKDLLAYAITDLGYRGQLPIEQLVGQHIPPEKMGFFAPAQALGSSAITVEDFQKLLITLPEVKYARLTPAGTSPKGLYDVLIEWEDGDLNDSLVLETLTANGKPFEVEFAFPYWDETEVAVWGSAVVLNQVTGVGQPLPNLIPFTEDELNDYFTTVDVRYDTNQTLRLTIVIRLGTSPEPADRPALEQAIASHLILLTPGTAIETFRTRVNTVFQQMNNVRALLSQHRNLGEDFVRFRSVRTQEIALRASVELAADADARQTLTDMLSAIDLFIDPVVRFSALAELQAQGLTNEAIYDGPLLSAGFLPQLEEPKQNLLNASDILQKMLQMPDGNRNQAVIAVENFSMSSYVRNRLTTVNAQNRLTLLRDEQFQPRLSVTKTDITFFRNGAEVGYDKKQVSLEVKANRQKAFLASTAGISQLSSTDEPAESLTPTEISEYHSIQYDLPLVYGLKAGTSDKAPPVRKAQERQLRAYLFFFEQLLANHLSQLANTATFFSFDADSLMAGSYFYQPLYNIPGIAPLLRAYDLAANWNDFVEDPNNAYVRRLRESAESPLERLLRKNKVLDHLLGRFGEELSELSRLEYTLAMQQATSLNDSQENRLATARRLLRYKATFLDDVTASAADRALGTSSNSVTELSGLERRLYRKIGILRQQRVRTKPELTDFFTIQTSGANQETFQLKDGTGAVLLVSTQTFATLPNRQVFTGIRSLIEVGIDPRFYSIQKANSTQWKVVVTSDNGAVIAQQPSLFSNPGDASTFVNKTVSRVYDALLADTYKGEGFCLIEHILLRPSQTSDPTLTGIDPYSLQLTLVFPSGFERDFANSSDLPKPGSPSRFQARDFRNYVEAVIEQECPAHLIPTVFWLDSDTNPGAGGGLSFTLIETQYQAWLGHYVGGTITTNAGRAARTALIKSLNTLRQV